MSKPIETTQTPTPTPAPTPPASDLTRPNVRVNAAGLAVLRRAITLRLAMLGEVGSDDPELHGAALVGVVKDWLQGQSERLRVIRD